MTEAEKYDGLLKATRRLILAAKQLHPLAGADKLETVCRAAINFELTTPKAA